MERYGAPAAHALYCSVDPEAYAPLERPKRWDLSYLGTYSPDRQPTLERLLLEPARRAPHLKFVVAGPLYPAGLDWPPNVERIDHVAPAEHPAFYAASRFTLNVTRSDMIRAGYSPSVRLFEAAACGIPIISDVWDGIGTFFSPGREIALARDAADVIDVLTKWPKERAGALAAASRERVLGAHTAAHRARQLETFLLEAIDAASTRQTAQPAAQAAPVKRSIVPAG
jgi:spore maturation protein CgeB